MLLFLAESREVRVGQNVQPKPVSHQVSPPSTRDASRTVCHCIARRDRTGHPGVTINTIDGGPIEVVLLKDLGGLRERRVRVLIEIDSDRRPPLIEPIASETWSTSANRSGSAVRGTRRLRFSSMPNTDGSWPRSSDPFRRLPNKPFT
jgi:hypothetical protein